MLIIKLWKQCISSWRQHVLLVIGMCSACAPAAPLLPPVDDLMKQAASMPADESCHYLQNAAASGQYAPDSRREDVQQVGERYYRMLHLLDEKCRDAARTSAHAAEASANTCERLKAAHDKASADVLQVLSAQVADQLAGKTAASSSAPASISNADAVRSAVSPFCDVVSGSTVATLQTCFAQHPPLQTHAGEWCSVRL